MRLELLNAPRLGMRRRTAGPNISHIKCWAARIGCRSLILRSLQNVQQTLITLHSFALLGLN